MSYLDKNFIKYIDKLKVKVIFELGSRDLEDALNLHKYYDCKVFAFECNPECLIKCHENFSKFTIKNQNDIKLIEKAISICNGPVKFYSFDLNKYNNMGASSMFKTDFTKRSKNDPDYNRENPQKEITVDSIRLDSFMNENNINNIDLLCIDLQGYELNALKSLGKYITNVKYIITECSIQSTYEGGCSFSELNKYLEDNNFRYIESNRFGKKFPDLNLKGHCEFDALFVNKNIN